MDSEQREELLARTIESLNGRVRDLERFLAVVFLVFMAMTFYAIRGLPVARSIDAYLGAAAIGVSLALLLWSRALGVWLSRRGVSPAWTGRLIAVLGVAALASFAPSAMIWWGS